MTDERRLVSREELMEQHTPTVDGWCDSDIYIGCTCGWAKDYGVTGWCPDFQKALAALPQPATEPALDDDHDPTPAEVYAQSSADPPHWWRAHEGPVAPWEWHNIEAAILKAAQPSAELERLRAETFAREHSS